MPGKTVLATLASASRQVYSSGASRQGFIPLCYMRASPLRASSACPSGTGSTAISPKARQNYHFTPSRLFLRGWLYHFGVSLLLILQSDFSYRKLSPMVYLSVLINLLCKLEYSQKQIVSCFINRKFVIECHFLKKIDSFALINK